ncbi:HEPN domain-containing protein [Bacillus cereus group sp. TH153LC]|uniref:HEPN domain-containing protein n=1 Tax=Bacillus cereus group sp. TH153LC TaxID=3018059 RepID=UPI0022E81B23|nr:HEPN domain-containing protein [Bacillus cereus group sp. TH153LC]MDA1662146.1 HEPN domain-containing protein [Bacillus cereus group sp. TH153LC]
MYQKELVRDTLIQALGIFEESDFSETTQKMKLDSDGHIITISPEKTVPLIYDSLLNIERFLTHTYDEPFVKFIIGYIVKAKSLNFIECIFEELFEEFQLYLDGNYVYRTVALIHNLDIQNKEIEFPDYILRPVDEEYIEYFYNSLKIYNNQHISRNMFDMRDAHEPNPNVLLEKKQIISEFKELESLEEQIKNLGKSILLCNGTLNHIHFSPVITFSYFDNNGMIRMIEYIREVRNESRRKRVVIKNPQLLTEYFDKLMQLPIKSIALDRLASAHNKISLEDKFIDLAIALESMYPNVKVEVLFRISLYTASLLDGSEATYNKVKKLYITRSNLVHGNSQLTRDKLLEQLEELDIIVRKVIVMSLEYSIQGLDLKKMEEKALKTLLPN